MIANLSQLKQSFLRSLIRFFIGSDKLQWYETIHWEQAIKTFESPTIEYPFYYTSVNFHGIEGGYLTSVAALTYDLITPLATLPNETWIRRCLLKAIENQPQHILDLGCGTGSNTILLKNAFPQANIIGLDLSPYMLIVAEDKAKQQNLSIQWLQGLAEATTFESCTFDLVTLAMVLHETPNQITQSILQEAFRLLKPGGQLIILDANQQRLRHILGLAKLFREPYSAVYSQGNINQWLQLAGFEKIKTKPVWWIYSISQAVKPKTK